jgi:hypothetical protein
MAATNLEFRVPAAQHVSRRGPSLADRYFYLFMGLLIPAIVVFGFSFTIVRNLIHPAVRRPLILYVHAVVFSFWLVFFLLQSILIRTLHVRWHRRLGWFGAGLGMVIPVLGSATAIIMARFNATQLHQSHVEADLIVPLWDMVAFTVTFAFAIGYRKRPEYHRRLVLAATCALTAAAFGRFPAGLLSPNFFYAGVDVLLAFGAIRDWIVDRRIHPVYLWTLPVSILGQTTVMYANTHDLPYWLRIAHAMLQ